jgi:glucose-1-phosphate cytidylyltransferase
VKVVLFCGGEGFQLPDQLEPVPKPMTTIGYRPILWHVMRYYAYWGVKDFVLCLGYKGNVVKDYFLRYNEALSNDFVMSKGGRDIELLGSDIHDWDITFVDTGLHTNIGQRLEAVEPYLRGEEIFLANYGDILTDAPLLDFVSDFERKNVVAAFLAVRPHYSFHVVSHESDGLVTAIHNVQQAGLWINGGHFLFRNEIFDFICDGEDLIGQTFNRLLAARQLVSYRFEGFWSTLDTLKDLQTLQSLHDGSRPPWALWLPNGEALR